MLHGELLLGLVGILIAQYSHGVLGGKKHETPDVGQHLVGLAPRLLRLVEDPHCPPVLDHGADALLVLLLEDLYERDVAADVPLFRRLALDVESLTGGNAEHHVLDRLAGRGPPDREDTGLVEQASQGTRREVLVHGCLAAFPRDLVEELPYLPPGIASVKAAEPLHMRTALGKLQGPPQIVLIVPCFDLDARYGLPLGLPSALVLLPFHTLECREARMGIELVGRAFDRLERAIRRVQVLVFPHHVLVDRHQRVGTQRRGLIIDGRKLLHVHLQEVLMNHRRPSNWTAG
mmetsp:Transcript_17941/g.40527  ORF Transcript_17941/g.40527 Transcript_17941/m.40527 type:complete len:290 (+) Transcript_17941:1296-2165(+)